MMIIVNNQCGEFVEKQRRTYALYNSAQILKFKVLLRLDNTTKQWTTLTVRVKTSKEHA